MSIQDPVSNKHTLNSELKPHSYLVLGENFYTRVSPTPVAQPNLIRLNQTLSEFLNLDVNQLNTPENLEIFSGNKTLSHASSLATVYAGHQFGNWNPQLGDGRALLLGEILAKDNKLYDIQLKGSGPTPYSRMGDGRSPIGPVLREYIVSEAMHSLAVPTTRALAAVSTGETVTRDLLLPGGILTRVAQSHIRIGTFQYFTARQQLNDIQSLADFVIHRHYQTDVQTEFPDNPYLGLLSLVVRRQAKLIAKWMSLGFIHGVMNTDNMLLSGETVDYGPCAFMDQYRHNKVFSSIDHHGRYAYCNQPKIAKWNVSWLAQALLPLIDTNEEHAVKLALSALDEFEEIYQNEYQALFARKLGFNTASDNSNQLVNNLLGIMEKEKLDFTNTFRALANLLIEHSDATENFESAYDTSALTLKAKQWVQGWLDALSSEGIAANTAIETIRTINPAYIPRNHQVNQAIDQAVDQNDFSLFNTLVDLLEEPFTYKTELAQFAAAPEANETIFRTFCGT
ncbi:protein adenylyltransferase SelO [Sessilibacter corallicola]|uniref:protein adenylyltransferase SelO n=1 Tax=Sessilibacter corallicola TaxID=2904075 RepID=UPI001E405F46|nr:YdiU family protein [Sessilibacter corallicola]MCE2027233.1 YdiU family protein [Sessilibacter corallicola]